jgi:MFS family permease
MALLVVGMTFSIRGDSIGALGTEYSLSNEQLGWIASAAFWGYTGSVFLGGQICDLLGIGTLLRLACAAHLAGILLSVLSTGFWMLWTATLTIGIGNALLEAGINPLVATIHPNGKTEKLNGVHAWFPWGIVGGGLLAFGLTEVGAGWRWKMAAILIPAIVYGVIYGRLKFPPTERVERDVSTARMYRESIRPDFLLWVFCMFLTAATELGPNQWIPNILTNTAHMPGILILVWINGLMALGRTFAGPVVHRLSPLGLLITASALSAVGLLGLSASKGPVLALCAATLFALGVCYFWPTMLGITAERHPEGGAWVLAVISGAGNLSAALILPAMGRIYDLHGPAAALRWDVVLPLALIAIFSAIRLYERRTARFGAARVGK